MFLSDVRLEDIPVEPLQRLFVYWGEIRGSRSMPARIDLQPAQLSTVLPLIVLIDVERDPDRYRIRLMGSESVRALGEDLTGQYLEQLYNPENLVENMDWLVENRQPYLSGGKVDWNAKNYMSYHALALPLSDNDRDVNMILFGINYFLNTGDGNQTSI